MLHQLIGMLEAPLVIFCLFVAPIWVFMHYKQKGRSAAPEESAADKKKIEELLAMADKMENRIETLESILDKQDPNWRHEV
ncbi:envelope stress response membrane protein PspB [Teredinibacter haidensis]|uniref:envelope stress response membrane protein PspB n=1 Tax=Teredinibacter haidensis TaxID=2731755 RepID=UPI0009491D06|nr:envelope stress response membrane protein PspB [Teredinibacter haidensis]